MQHVVSNFLHCCVHACGDAAFIWIDALLDL